MAKKRAFSRGDIDEKSPDYHGMAKYCEESRGQKAFNVHFTFAEALRLSLAIQACTLGLNRHDRRRGSLGSELGMSLSFKMESKSVAVIEIPLRKGRKAPNGSN